MMRTIPVVMLLIACDPAASGGAGDGSGDGINGDGDGGPTGPCAAVDALVTDIDATLTISETEFAHQSFDPAYDPEMRPDANDLMRGYAQKGYAIVYVTTRGEDQPIQGGATAQEVTEEWLVDHGFPFDAGRVFLAPGLGAVGQTYKADLLEQLQAEYAFRYGYGNASADITAYRDAGISDEDLFLVGDLAGQMGVEGISNAEAFTHHVPFLSQVPDAGCPDE